MSCVNKKSIHTLYVYALMLESLFTLLNNIIQMHSFSKKRVFILILNSKLIYCEVAEIV